MTPGRASGTVLHASCVALSGRGLLILGPSGAGKSGLALQLMACGCALVSDDRTAVAARDGVLAATAPELLRGKIEARGVGILSAKVAPVARIRLCVDMGQEETDRLPPFRRLEILGVELPLLHRCASGYFPFSVLQYLKAGRAE